MPEIIAVEVLWVGKMADVEGVAVIVNPHTATQIILSIPANIAINGGQALRDRGIGEPMVAAAVSTRERPAALDG